MARIMLSKEQSVFVRENAIMFKVFLWHICTDFVADELDKIITDLSVMNADMTDEEHADAMASLLLLRDEARYALSDVLNDFI